MSCPDSAALRAEVERLTTRLLFREADAERLAEALSRLVGDIETNSEAGAPDYAFTALRQHEGLAA